MVWYGIERSRRGLSVRGGTPERVCKPTDSDLEDGDEGEEDGKLGWVQWLDGWMA